jgi:hypothetical protein
MNATVELVHSPKCDQPGTIVEHGEYATTMRCAGCGATTTRKKDD